MKIRVVVIIALFAVLMVSYQNCSPTGPDSAPAVNPETPAQSETVKIVPIAAGQFHTCGLKDGNLRCWGSNNDGALGIGTTVESLTPAPVQDFSSGNTQVFAVGLRHTCAIADGALKCWGLNSRGQLGDGSSVSQTNTPVQVEGLTNAVQTVAAGAEHTCALVKGGVQCWGSNTSGQLGHGLPVSQSNSPVQVQGLTSGVQNIAANGNQTCALVKNGMLCWGDDKNTRSQTPRQVPGLTSGVQAMALGEMHTCALVSGAVQCWGINENGQLGDGTVAPSPFPKPVPGLASPPVTGGQVIAGGHWHTCAISTGGTVMCWGDNSLTQMGDGTIDGIRAPSPVADITDAVHIAAGSFHTCALSASDLKCWGSNTYGQLGNGTKMSRGYPVVVLDY